MANEVITNEFPFELDKYKESRQENFVSDNFAPIEGEEFTLGELKNRRIKIDDPSKVYPAFKVGDKYLSVSQLQGRKTVFPFVIITKNSETGFAKTVNQNSLGAPAGTVYGLKMIQTFEGKKFKCTKVDECYAFEFGADLKSLSPEGLFKIKSVKNFYHIEEVK